VRMHDAVTRLAFEEAAVLRDQIKSLRLIQEQQGVVQHRGDADVIVLDAHPGRACILCVTIRAGEILASQAFFPKVPELVMDEEISPEQAVFSAFIAHHYVDSPERIPALILTNQAVDHVHETEALLSELRGKRCRIQTNPRGANARWLDFAKHNLAQSIAQHAASAHTMALRFQALCALIKRPYPLSRMECFDISHTQGDSTVASCVVFNENGPLKSDYRRFNIQGITPGDDYAAMEQALSRRFKRRADASFGCLPDVLIIDGGKGQLDVAKRVLSDLNIEGVTLIGIAKGASRKAGWERLFINDAEEITLERDSEALHLLQHIRDEAHRFAITAHRAKRQKTSLSSSLTSIEGVGPKRRQALLSRFGGLRELAKAPVEELMKVQGIREDLARRIYLHFHPKG
jgi:excinuclease ABC subunit C